MLPAMPWTFSTSVPLAVSFLIPSAPNALLEATVVSLANHRASSALQGQAILWSQAHPSLRALRVCLPPTVLPVNRIAATVPPVTTALIQPVIRRFVLQALTALPRAALPPFVFIPATVLPVNRIAATVPPVTTALIQPVVRRFAPQALTALPRAAHPPFVIIPATVLPANRFAATVPPATTALIPPEVL
jgi:hypothetical protein